MKKLFSRRPSPSMVVSLIALVVASSGTAIAASKLTSGDKLIKKRSLSGNRLKNHTITGTQINLSKLGTVPAAKNAQAATTAATAGSAATASTATFATNAASAATATNATTFGGLLPAAYQVSLPWALFDGNGTIRAQSGGISLIAGPTGAGYWIGFPVHLKAVMVTSAYTNANRVGRGTPIAEVCGGATGLVNCVVPPNDTTEAFVSTFASNNATPVDEPFMIVGIP